MADSSQVSYCSDTDVLRRLYPGQSSSSIPADEARDDTIREKIQSISRRFERETSRPLNGFAPVYEARLFSGDGTQHLALGEFAVIRTIEFNRTVVGTPDWQDLSSELTTGVAAYKPIRFWPKSRLFRQQTFITDPYGTGNYRLTGIWGAIQPDLAVAAPKAQSPPWNGLTDGQIDALTPGGVASPAGWWITPKDVKGAVADWVEYDLMSDRTGKADPVFKPNQQQAQFSTDIPPSVMAVIRLYRGGSAKLALVGLDGSDARDENSADPQVRSYRRWSNWHAYDPSGVNTW